MKKMHKTLAAVALLAFLYLLGCVGGAEAGKLSLGELLVHCVAALSVMWAAMAAYNKITEEREQ